MAGGLLLGATALTGAPALVLPGLFSDYGVQYRAWAALRLAAANYRWPALRLLVKVCLPTGLAQALRRR